MQCEKRYQPPRNTGCSSAQESSVGTETFLGSSNRSWLGSCYHVFNCSLWQLKSEGLNKESCVNLIATTRSLREKNWEITNSGASTCWSIEYPCNSMIKWKPCPTTERETCILIQVLDLTTASPYTTISSILHRRWIWHVSTLSCKIQTFWCTGCDYTLVELTAMSKPLVESFLTISGWCSCSGLGSTAVVASASVEEFGGAGGSDFTWPSCIAWHSASFGVQVSSIPTTTAKRVMNLPLSFGSLLQIRLLRVQNQLTPEMGLFLWLSILLLPLKCLVPYHFP